MLHLGQRQGHNILIRRHQSVQHKAAETVLGTLESFIEMFVQDIPQDIVLVSAGEITPLLNAQVQHFCLQLAKKVGKMPLFISAACTSLHAAILDFGQSDSQRRLVIHLDIDRFWQQGCLNSLGIGNGEEQDGLNVVNSGAICLLEKSNEAPAFNQWLVEDCFILSQPKGVFSTQLILNQLTDYLQQLPQHLPQQWQQQSHQIVSFRISSLWGEKLLKALNSRLKGDINPQNWLNSAEPDTDHYLSVKPLMELANYKKHNNLLLITLGGGGRIGLLKVSKNSHHKTLYHTAGVTEQSLSDDFDSYLTAKALYQDSFYHRVKETLKYPRDAYRGINNHYFRWDLNALATLGQSLDQSQATSYFHRS